MAKIDFMFLYDSKVREFDSLILLKKTLDNLNYRSVIIPMHYNRYYYAIKFQPKVILLPFFYSQTDGNYLIYKKLYPNTIFINIHSEQIYNQDTKSIMMPTDECSREVYHISWGSKFANELIKSKVKKSKIFITGSIRNDLIYFKANEQKLNVKNVLIPSSFGLSMMPRNYIENIEKIIEPNKLKKQIDFMAKSRVSFFRIIYSCSLTNSNLNFIIRPHPHVDVQNYIKVFLKDINQDQLPLNIIIERKGSIYDFFNTGKKIICWHSTTALEGTLMKKEVAILAPEKFPKFMEMDYFKFFEIKTNEEQVNEFLFNRITNELLDNYIKKIYFKVDGKSHERLARVLEKLTIEHNNYHRNNKMFFVYVVMAILKDIPKFILLKLNLLHVFFESYKGMIEDSDSITNLK